MKSHYIGANSCKGQSARMTAKNACAGQSSCKGQGIIETTASKRAEIEWTMFEALVEPRKVITYRHRRQMPKSED